jgi:hypothetical protein
MDSQEKDESRARLRDEALARRMGEALDRISAAGAGDCPDAELIAAYHERTLHPEEIAQCESHFAGCSRCRKILAVLAASVDAPLSETEVARLGELVAAAARPADAATHPPAKIIYSKRFNWRARWLAPALGVAAVLAMWFAMRAPWSTTGQAPAETLVAQAPKSETPQQKDLRSLDEVSGTESKKAPEPAAAIPSDRSPAKSALAAVAPESPETNRAADSNSLEQRKAKVAAAETVPRNEKESRAAAASAASGVIAPAAPPPVAAVAQLQAANGVAAPISPGTDATSNSPALDKQAMGSLEEGSSKSAARSAAEIANGGQRVQALSSAMGAAKSEAIQIEAPSGKVLWRAGMGGKIERSSDAGRTWIPQPGASQSDWLTGAATSDTVCWLVGRNGSIARTTDGEHWMQIASPGAASGPANQFPDWMSVTASNAQIATITSSANQRYRTEDGGQTWRLQ